MSKTFVNVALATGLSLICPMIALPSVFNREYSKYMLNAQHEENMSPDLCFEQALFNSMTIFGAQVITVMGAIALTTYNTHSQSDINDALHIA